MEAARPTASFFFRVFVLLLDVRALLVPSVLVSSGTTITTICRRSSSVTYSATAEGALFNASISNVAAIVE